MNKGRLNRNRVVRQKGLVEVCDDDHYDGCEVAKPFDFFANGQTIVQPVDKPQCIVRAN